MILDKLALLAHGTYAAGGPGFMGWPGQAITSDAVSNDSVAIFGLLGQLAGGDIGPGETIWPYVYTTVGFDTSSESLTVEVIAADAAALTGNVKILAQSAPILASAMTAAGTVIPMPGIPCSVLTGTTSQIASTNKYLGFNFNVSAGLTTGCVIGFLCAGVRPGHQMHLKF